MSNENQSEVARLLAQFDSEYQAAQLGLSGLAYGTSIHEFITAKMEGMEKARGELTNLVGEEKATELIVEQWSKDKK